ncbi:hypothetical protein NK553_04135 [Pseudomonas sp. ZM23]|uniref:Uncharacterized protein n=1 Tax=Pseudomonas triclosanedens TaxID=2961893 RepID=A0ABY6ZXD0_9PSED|nr:hypothetical protein [Pseudomonas triclosanedens]MCP8463130.1 hypothetical protein [Pseudomonas triclosanedens]MCP8469811.1 hypothetical protein [Pseudomonas triclosanedens]MCP8473931.1 hypothetical protein [Pseudomonas triclosanedens]WAI48670.1 hypothetical protein OU419_23365 [Pseudomonas triclosanedens]
MMRLATVSEELVERMAAATSEQRKRAVIAACDHAIKAVSLSNSVVSLSMERLRRGEIFSPRLVSELNSLVEKLDGEYFVLQENSGDEAGFDRYALRAFSQARAISALAFGGVGESLFSSAESIYEASAAVDDIETFLKAVVAALSEQ